METVSKQNSAIKPIALFFWLTAIGLLVFLISSHQIYTAKVPKVVAVVLQSKGEVFFRGEKNIVWHEAYRGAGIIDGDRIATGKGSAALVKFTDGRSLALGSHSHVIVSTITHLDNTMTFLIHLVKGAVTADSKVECKGCRDIVLTSGGQSFVLSKGKSESFVRNLKSTKIEKISAMPEEILRIRSGHGFGTKAPKPK